MKTRVVVWAGGLKAATLAGAARLPQGHGGRIDVQPDLTVAGFPSVSVLGDLANTRNPAGGIGYQDFACQPRDNKCRVRMRFQRDVERSQPAP